MFIICCEIIQSKGTFINDVTELDFTALFNCQFSSNICQNQLRCPCYNVEHSNPFFMEWGKNSLNLIHFKRRAEILARRDLLDTFLLHLCYSIVTVEHISMILDNKQCNSNSLLRFFSD